MHLVDDSKIRAALDSLRRIVRALRLSASETEKQAGISMAQLFVLRQLADGKPRSLVELAAETLTDPSSVSAVVRRLVDARLVSRRVAPRDTRRAEVTLTAAGKRLAARAPEAPQSRLFVALAELPPRRLNELTAGLEHLARAVGVARGVARDAGHAPLFFEEDEAPRKRNRGGARARA
jgi:DNA-binding MarR family transcriptional regulator